MTHWPRRFAGVLALVVSTGALATPATPFTVLPAAEQRSIAGGCEVSSGVAWWSDHEVLVACRNGVHRLDLSTGEWSTGLPNDTLPAGLAKAKGVATDGEKILGFAYYEQFLADGEDGSRLFARRNPDYQVLDLGIAGERMYLLGWKGGMKGPEDTGGVALWSGPLALDWSTLEPVHRIGAGPQAIKDFGDAIGPYGGAIAMGSDGTVAVTTTVEPGIFVYDRDGRLVEVLGTDLDQLTIRRMYDALEVYRTDVAARYREILNRQPMVDDLVMTSNGPALVVRRPKGAEVSWELWFPGEKGVNEVQRLDVRSRRPYAHLDCDARRERLVCVFLQRRPETPTWELDGSTAEARLAVFELGPVHEVARKTPSGP